VPPPTDPDLRNLILASERRLQQLARVAEPADQLGSRTGVRVRFYPSA
jgi:hypothetical protein